MQQPRNKQRGRWGFFFIGFAVGIGITVSLFLVKRKIEKDDTFVINIFKPNSHEEDSTFLQLQSAEDKIPVPIIPFSRDTNAVIEEVVVPEIVEDIESEESNYEDVEFSIDTKMTEEIYLFDEIIRSRQVQVTDRSIDFDSLNKYNPPYAAFEIQQWSTPIRNSVTYQRENNILKIKGLNIDSVSVYYRNGNYYLLYKNNSHIIPVNHTFEKVQ